MSEPDILSLTEVAAELRAHYDTVRKHWREWAGLTGDRGRFIGFPLPCRYPMPGERGVLGWRRSAIAAWKLARETALGEGRSAPHVAPAPGAAPPVLKSDPRLKRERAQLHQLLERA